MNFFEGFMMIMMFFYLFFTVNINDGIEQLNKEIKFLNEYIINEFISRSKDND